MSFVIRQACIEELPRLAAVEQSAARRFRESAHPYAERLSNFDPRHLAELGRAGTVWVAEAGESELAGFAIGGYLGDEPYLHELDVVPSWGRRGIGSALVCRVGQWARDEGKSTLLLATFSDVPWNAPYYARLGFEPVPLADYRPEMLAQRAADGAVGIRLTSRVMMRASLTRLLG